VSTAPGNSLTTRCHIYIIGNRFNKGRDASLFVEMGNVSS
jgi:hypothetical protein